ncbi:MAG TPA: ABC transporter permease [Anaeromyxobacter sp.]|nr:ABC transporter permease [Anaeromyxobacter sp.]
MNDARVPTAPPPSARAAPGEPEHRAADSAAPQPEPAQPGAGHPAPPVFSFAAFVLVAIGTFGAAALAPVAQVFFGDRLALPSALATGLAALAAAAFAALCGVAAAVVARRLAFYELAVAVLVWAGVVAIVATAAPLRGTGALAALEAQGKLVTVLGLLGAGLLAATAAFAGSTLAYLAIGNGRLDTSLSYELFVARSHLRLTPRTLAALFGIVVTGLVPGLLVALAWSLVRDARARRAYRRGELFRRERMPATLLMTLISIGGVAIGVWALTVVLSVMSGFEADLKRKILGHNAHGMVLTYGQNEFDDWRGTRQKVLGVKGVVGATPFLYNEVMLSAGQNLTGAILKGIDVDTVGTVTDLPRNVEEGKLDWLRHPEQIPRGARPPGEPTDVGGPDGDGGDRAGGTRGGGDGAPADAGVLARKVRPLPGIVVGRELARSLRVFVGDQVNVVSPFGDLGPAGPQPKARPFRVAAIFYSGMYEYDSKFAYMDLDEGQRFFGTSTVTGLELKVADVDAARATMSRVVYALGGWPFRAKDWGELNRSLFSALQMEKVVMAVILGFIVLVASFIIVATLIMLVLEKTKEIAVLKSMGAGVPSIMKVFVAEGLIIGAIGTAFGLILGYGSCLLIDKVGIPLDPEVYYISNLPVLIEPAQFALVTLAALALSYLATIYPATKAARLRPVDGLRAE